MFNDLGLCKDVLQQFINIPRFSLVQVSDKKKKSTEKWLQNIGHWGKIPCILDSLTIKVQ
jgi:hypothetical protein